MPAILCNSIQFRSSTKHFWCFHYFSDVQVILPEHLHHINIFPSYAVQNSTTNMSLLKAEYKSLFPSKVACSVIFQSADNSSVIMSFSNLLQFSITVVKILILIILVTFVVCMAILVFYINTGCNAEIISSNSNFLGSCYCMLMARLQYTVCNI